ncbi:MAG: spermidine/putrescine ABC transporter substrate-binding protein [Opitutia bacterium]|nr:spermidine/putrescine ABC transporter substrate-binding protein [Opitutaceae bacterium]PHX86351.1 MAG: spermidine/putrescine ABC transporter substrate-binding protein [Opitutae bacterium]
MKLIRKFLTLGLVALTATGAFAANKKGELKLFGWSEYVPQAVLDGFTAETGIKVSYETYASGEEMLAKLLSGGTRYDLIQPPDYVAEALIKDGLLTPIDQSKLKNFGNLMPEFLKMPHDPEQKFTVPYMVGTVGIVVNTEKITEPVLGYRDLFSAKHKNRIVALDDGRELAVAALYVLGKDMNDFSPANLAAVRPILAEWFPRIKLFDSDSPKTALLNGDVDLGLVWGGEAAKLWQENKKFQYVLPSEGAHLFIDLLAIPKRARNVENAHLFIDYILRPEVSKLISDEFPYTNPNAAARKLLSPDQLANPGSYPTTTRKLDTFRHIGDVGSAIDELITDLKNTK